MKACINAVAAGFKKGTTPKIKGILRTGDHRLLNAKGIPAQLPIVVESLALSAHEL